MGDRYVSRQLPTQITRHGVNIHASNSLRCVSVGNLIDKNRKLLKRSSKFRHARLELLCVDVTVARNDTLPDIRKGLLCRADKLPLCLTEAATRVRAVVTSLRHAAAAGVN
jgi:hypothetical protein